MVLGTSAAGAETLNHQYDMRVGGLRVATANVRADVTGRAYSATAALEARGLVGAITSGSFTASVRGATTGTAQFVPQTFTQTGAFRGRDTRLDIAYVDGTPVSTVYTPEREADDKPIPTLSKQSGTVDFLTAMLTLTMPGTPQEICTRRLDAFTFTKRTRIEGQGVVARGDGTLTCRVSYLDVDPETLVADPDPDPYTLELRPMADGRYEVARILGATDLGTAIIARTN
jgi:hypothetical protein